MEEVRRLRLDKGWNQTELAYHAKLAPSVISLLETGKREPNASTLRKLAEALGVTIPDLFRESGSSKAATPPPPEDGERGSKKPEPSFHDEEERLKRYLSVTQRQAKRKAKLWRIKVSKDVFDAEEFRKGVEELLDLESDFAQGVGTDLLAALLNHELALPEAEREALDNAEASIDDWHGVMREAHDSLEKRGASNILDIVPRLRQRWEEQERGEFARSGKADDGANVS